MAFYESLLLLINFTSRKGKGMDETPKIRIIWIDDRERPSGKPEKLLDPDLARWFEVMHPSSSASAVMSYEAASSFMQEFERFWHRVNDGKRLYFPAEIVVVDYNLDKSSAAERSDEEPPDPPGAFRPATQALPSVKRTTAQVRDVNFDGLLIGTFYSALTARHPAAMVSITNYMGEMPSEVKTLHSLVTPFLGVNFEHNLPSNERSWRNIVTEGVRHLRRRIIDLYKSGDITLSTSDLMTLTEDNRHGVLTIHSPYAMRKLPVQGLFIDVSKENRGTAVNKWASELMQSVMTDCEELRQAQELAGVVWDAYNNNKLVEDRKNLSLLASHKEAGKEIDQKEYDRLCEAFGVAGKKAKSRCVDIISTGDYSDRVRRWAVLLITLNMLKKLIRIRKRVDSLRISDYVDIHPTGPILTSDDLFLSLFPAPESPLILPWHNSANIDMAAGWVRSMMRWKDKKEVRNNRGDLALSVRDLLAGEVWKEEGPYGLTASERLVLRGFALEDMDLTEADWRACNRANLVLWGNRQRTGHA
jgi:hypothetical protein